MAATATRAPGFVRNLPRLNSRVVLITSAIVLAFYFIAPPLLVTIWTAFRGPGGLLPFAAEARTTFANFTQVYESGVLGNTLVDTGVFVAGSLMVSFIVGLTLAWLVERTNMPLRNFVFVVLFVPIILPALVTTIGWVLLLGYRNGLINQFIRLVTPLGGDEGPINPYSMTGLIIVQGIGGMVIMFIFLSAAFRSMDTTFEEASRASGASFARTVWHITLPILRPAILSVVFLGAIINLESFEVPVLLTSSGRVADIFSTRVFYAINNISGGSPQYGLVAALGLHFLILTYGLFFLYARFTRRAERFATVTARGFRPKAYDLGRWRWPVAIVVLVLLALQAGLPMLTLLWTSFFPAYRPVSSVAVSEFANLNQYRAILARPEFWPAFRNSMVIALSAATISVVCSLIIAWTVTRARKQTLGLTVLDLFTSSSLAIPGVIAAVAFHIYYLFVDKAVPIFGTIFVLILAFSYRMTLSYRLNRAGIAQVSKELEECSSTSGASQMQTLWRIVIPLIAPNVLIAWFFLFITAFREFTLALVLAPNKPITMGVFLWNRFQGFQGQASALGIIMAGFMLVVVVIIRFGVWGRIQRRRA